MPPQEMDVELREFDVSRPEDFDPAFKDIEAWRPQALLYSLTTPITSPEIQRIVDFANASRIPSFFDHRSHANAGGLLTYGPDNSEVAPQSTGYVDRILRGESPGTLPVQMPTRYELVVNQKAASSLGIKIPQYSTDPRRPSDRVVSDRARWQVSGELEGDLNSASSCPTPGSRKRPGPAMHGNA